MDSNLVAVTRVADQHSRYPNRLGQFLNPPLQKSTLWFLPGEIQSGLVSGSCVGRAAQATKQIGSRGVKKMVVFQISESADGINCVQARFRPVTHRDRNSSIEFHDRGRMDNDQCVIQRCDVAPVGIPC